MLVSLAMLAASLGRALAHRLEGCGALLGSTARERLAAARLAGAACLRPCLLDGLATSSARAAVLGCRALGDLLATKRVAVRWGCHCTSLSL
jgi:hypothetical protein